MALLVTRPVESPSAHRRTAWITLFALLSAGWATNHFAALLPALADVSHISKPGLDAAFGLYALGLLPSLMLGGGISDRRGRRPVVLTGLVLAATGNLVMLLWPTLTGVVLGRLVVGLGVGMVASAGTAWAADQDAAKGAARAGVVLTSGFAIGPVASALLAVSAPGRPGIVLAYAVPVVLTGVAALLIMRPHATAESTGTAARRDDNARPAPFVDERRIGPALAAALPMGLWVFSCVVVAVIVLTERIGDRFSGPMLIAVACALSLGTGMVAQISTRTVVGWRPLGVIGAGLATAGFAIAAVAGAQMGLATFVLCALVLGSAYGLCLGQGLQDVERLAPRHARGLVTGLFYVVSYSGFALGFVLNTYVDSIGSSTPLLVLAALAAVTALARSVGVARSAQRRPAS
ncbi:MFS transporter [Janibacter limosus]|uniref:MFS transporter n=1 Tax=Janibacter limosus TaxID=53458 RepID=A0A4P6MWJ1_9MICO|nr:MFS transporter [Janibacter limosus]